MEDLTLVSAVGDKLCAAEQQRVVGDKQLRTFCDGFFGGGGERIHGEEHGVHGGGGAARDETGGVPTGGELRREERVEGVDDVCEGGGCEFFSHASIVTGGEPLPR